MDQVIQMSGAVKGKVVVYWAKIFEDDVRGWNQYVLS